MEAKPSKYLLQCYSAIQPVWIGFYDQPPFKAHFSFCNQPPLDEYVNSTINAIITLTTIQLWASSMRACGR